MPSSQRGGRSCTLAEFVPNSRGYRQTRRVLPMLPAAFEYASPGTLDDALALLDQHADDGKVLAGGQSLIPLLKLRLASPAFLVDINRLPDLDVLEERVGALGVGALARHKTAERSSLLANRYAVLAWAAPQVAVSLVRNWCTLAVSLCHAGPCAVWW